MVDLLFAAEISVDTMGSLEVMIVEHHTQFVKLYPECSVIPKMHYMIHMPRLIMRFVYTNKGGEHVRNHAVHDQMTV